MDDLQQILLSCPKFRVLHLIIDHDDGVGHTNIGDFDLEPNQMLPPLEELKLDGYSWSKSWAKNLDWSHLRKLDFSDIGLAKGIAPYLTGLQALELHRWGHWLYPTHHRQGAQEINTFLLECVSLKEIRLMGLTGDIPVSTIARHGKTLEHLKLHETERYAGPGIRPVLSIQDLKCLSIECPRLEILDIDLNRNGQWPYDVFDVLGTFPSVFHLSLTFELGVSDMKAPLQPVVTVASAGHIFAHIRSRALNPEFPRLRFLDIASGTIRRMTGNGYPMPWIFWEHDECANFWVELAVRDEDARAGKLLVLCNGVDYSVERDRNYILEAARKADEENSDEDEDENFFSGGCQLEVDKVDRRWEKYQREKRRAFNGPHPSD